MKKIIKIPTEREWNATKRHNRRIDKEIAKVQKRIDKINDLYWERESLFEYKRKLETQYKLP